MTGLFGEETYSVSRLCGEIRDYLRQAFASVWVVGEVNRVRHPRSGHLYFELVEKGDADEIVGKLEAVAWRRDHQAIQRTLMENDLELAEGVEIRCRGSVDFYAPFGRLQFVAREIDPVFSLGMMARRRKEILDALTAAGLLQKNRQLPLSDLPLTIALVTSEGTAAYQDFITTLQESGYGFRVIFLHSAVQGRDAEREVSAALGQVPDGLVDCAVLIRGGGSRADLAAFDSRRIAEAIAHCPVPVLTGLGHEIDHSIADLAAHTALKTPTKAAEFLVDRMAVAERRLNEVRRGISREALRPLRRGREALGRAERGLSMARFRVESAARVVTQVEARLSRAARSRVERGRQGLAELAARLALAAPRLLDRRRTAPDRLVRLAVAAARARLRERQATLGGMERLCRSLGPEKTLERGFSITSNAAGRALRSPAEPAVGEIITTRLARGSLASRVEES